MRTPSVHARIERAFWRWGELVVRRPGRVIAGSLLVAGVLGSGLARLTADFSNESYLLPGDATRRVYDAFRERYGSADRVTVGVGPAQVFDLGFLERLRALHEDLEREVPHVEEVLSLVNARSTRGEGDELVVEELMEEGVRDAASLETFRERVLDNPLYRNRLISEDGSFTVLSIEPVVYSSRGEDADWGGFDEAPGEPPAYLSGAEMGELIARVRAVLVRHARPDFRLHAVGGEVMGDRLQSIAIRDSGVYSAVSVLCIAALLLLLFRRVTAAVLPLLVVVISALATFGAMGHLGVPVTLLTQILPSFLIAVGICDAVHIVSMVYRRLAAGDSQPVAIARALEHSGLAVVLTSLTTAGGLASFLAAEISPVAQLGVVAPIGVLLALAATVTLLPALLAVVPLRPPRGAGDRGVAGPVDAVLARLAAVATRRPVAVLLATVLLVAAGLPAVRGLAFSNDWLGYLFEDDPVRVAMERIDERLGGIGILEVLVDTGRENGLHEPETLARLEAAAAYARSFRDGPVRVGSTSSIVDVVKEIHRALNENRPEFYVLPDDRRLVAQELLLFENSGSDDLDDVTDTRFREARLTVRANYTDGMLYVPFLEEFDRGLREILGDDLGIELTGGLVLSSRTFSLLLGSLARSYALALLVITPLMVLLIGDWGRGLLAMIPNLLPVYLTLALMGGLGIPVDFSTLIIGSIVIGVAVDDTIHFMHQFSRYQAQCGDPREAVRRTFATTGTALLVTTLVLAVSFYVFLFGQYYGMVYLGLLAGSAVLIAFLADVLVAPALMVLATRGWSGTSSP